MGDTISLKKIKGDIRARINGMVDRCNLLDGYIARIVIPDYLRAQRERFENQNVGSDFEGGEWAALDPKYADYKRRKYANYPGTGAKTLIRTSRMLSSILLTSNSYDEPTFEGKSQVNAMLGIYGKSKDVWAVRKLSKKRKEATGGGAEYASIIRGGTLSIYSFVPYAQAMDELRTFSKWSDSFYQRQLHGAMDYVMGKIE